ncbi:hypothetical protein PYCC9005_004920 [Savitreella phatthalungensis]
MSSRLAVLPRAGQTIARNVKQLLVLDSSFNPPHLAHFSLLKRALEHAPLESPSAVLLMYATRNADKGSKGQEDTDNRLALIQAFSTSVARDLHEQTYICLTQEPFFKDKFEALREYLPQASQTYIVGYDTFVRILDGKYYPDRDLKAALSGFFAKGRLVCALRQGDSWGDYDAQRQHVERIRSGKEGGIPAGWGDAIEVMTLANDEGMGVSSTAVREAVKTGDTGTLERLVLPEVREVIATRGLYTPQFPPLLRSHVLACSYSAWHPLFRHISPRVRIIRNLPRAFIGYLDEDGLMLPQDKPRPPPRLQEISSESSFEDEGFSEVDPTEAFAELHQEITSLIGELGGSVVPKLNWSSPRDAVWISADRTLRCRDPSDIYLLLKSSDFINHDLGGHAFENCVDDRSALRPEEVELVLKKWFDVRPSLEFRCFVLDKRLKAISQRDPNPYDFLGARRGEIVGLAKRLFEDELVPKLSLDNFAFDIYVSPAFDKVWLMDISPCARSTDGLLFSWPELLTLQGDDVELRLVDEHAVMASHPQFSAHQVPYDLVDGSDGRTVAEFAEEFQRRLASAAIDDAHDDESRGQS